MHSYLTGKLVGWRMNDAGERPMLDRSLCIQYSAHTQYPTSCMSCIWFPALTQSRTNHLLDLLSSCPRLHDLVSRDSEEHSGALQGSYRRSQLGQRSQED